MGMFCYQCQETAGGKGCTVRGVCGKTEEVAQLQDVLIYVVKGISELVFKSGRKTSPEEDREVLTSLFMTITNANFDAMAIEEQIAKMVAIRDKLSAGIAPGGKYHNAVFFRAVSRKDMLAMAAEAGIMADGNEDSRSLRSMIMFGIKGMAAYAEHAANLGKEDPAIYSFIYEALASTLDETLSADELTALVLKTGEYGVKTMALLDSANTSRYGNPEITEVNIGVRSNPAILISGHDLTDLEQLLEQTQGTGIDVYTHGEMLPAHYYPAFKKYPHFAGNYGNAWWQQLTEFESFHGPILFTTNCIVPPRSEEIRKRIFTTGAAGYPGCTHIPAGPGGKKDFSVLIALAKTLPVPVELENGTITGGFAHNQVSLLAGKIIAAVKSGTIKQFYVMAGCDGRMKSREYYTEFARKLPADTIILTAGCAKYRYNKLSLGNIGGIPRVLDAGQCNDSYSLVVTALTLKDAFGLDDINKLPIIYNIAWYEQKAVIVLLALLYLGIKNIHLGPSLPGFLSPGVARILVEKFGIAGIDTADTDIARFTALSR